ncbi:MAG TPA: DNA-processing protein DprA [Clostridia bacterium]|nr:DNA-processing protein DprA [Clostridia bacterium]
MSSAPSSLDVSALDLQWLALSLTPSLGPTRSRRLLERFGAIDQIFRASLTELEAAGLQAVAAQAIALGESVRAAESEVAKAAAAGARVLTPASPEFPLTLQEIYDPPLALFVTGAVETLTRPGIAVVGTRHPTPYGLGMAERLSCDLAARGLIIFSGMARGVDSAAHRGAVNAGGRTVAVFGTGVDVLYPRENRKLAEQIVANGGALVSEFPMGTTPQPHNFPIRNRIISGISSGVLVVEAGEYSGTRITARCALEQSREVFAVPGNVTNKLSWGPNTLIKQGAKLVATWEDVWEELPTQIRLLLKPPATDEAERSEETVTAPLFDQSANLSPNEKKVFAVIKADESIHIDEIVERFDSQLSSSDIFSALFELEMSGKIRQMPGKNYVRCF